MPNPKFGTVTNDVASTIHRVKKGLLQFRNDKGGTVSVSIGRAAFSDEQLTDNFYAFFSEIMRLRPSGVPGGGIGGYVENVTVSTTQGKGFPVKKAELAAAAT
jgi:large subunit ribosomal protein L1